MIDWGAGRYETTAAELAPVSALVVKRAALAPDEAVLDVACGTGNAALLAAERGARVIGVDAAPRLLEVARARAAEHGLGVDFRPGDLLALPVEDASVDVVLSVFGVIFASDPGAALTEIARVLRPDGRGLITAWVPAGPINDMLAAMGRVMQRVTGQAPPPRRLGWSDPEELRPVAAGAGLRLVSTEPAELAIRGDSVQGYIESSRQHPMGVATRPVVEAAGAVPELEEAMAATLRAANEDPSALLLRSPYVVHELLSSS